MGDELEVNLEEFTVRIERTGECLQAKQVSGIQGELLREGGLVEYYKKHKTFPWINMND